MILWQLLFSGHWHLHFKFYVCVVPGMILPDLQAGLWQIPLSLLRSDMSLCHAFWVLSISGGPGHVRSKMFLQPVWWPLAWFPPLQLTHRRVSSSPFLPGFPSAFGTWWLALCLTSSWNAAVSGMEHSQCLTVCSSSPPFRTASF